MVDLSIAMLVYQRVYTMWYDVGMKHNHIPVGENKVIISQEKEKLGPHGFSIQMEMNQAVEAPKGTIGFRMNLGKW